MSEVQKPHDPRLSYKAAAAALRREADRFRREERQEYPEEAFRRDRGPWLVGLLDDLLAEDALPASVRASFPLVFLENPDIRWTMLVAGIAKSNPDAVNPGDASLDWL